MFERIRTWFRHRGSLDRREHMTEYDRPIENTDAWAATASHSVHGANDGVGHEPIGGGMPPNYVHSYDEGRPRK